MARKYFCAYYSYLDQLEELTEEEIGRLFLAMLRYAANGEVPRLSGNERFIFPGIRGQIDRDTQQYEEICEKNRQNIQKRYEDKQALRSYTNATNEKEKEKEKENENDMDKERERDKEKKSPPLPPTMAEVKDYVYERHYDFDAEKFFSYYKARGWCLGTQPMADWRAAADTWAKDEAAHRQRYGGQKHAHESREEYERKMQDYIRRLNGADSGG